MVVLCFIMAFSAPIAAIAGAVAWAADARAERRFMEGVGRR